MAIRVKDKLQQGRTLISRFDLAAMLAMCALVFFIIPSFAQAAIIKPANNLGLVGYWNLDEGRGTTAFDHSTGAHNGTLSSSPTWITGKLGQALTFGASNNYVSTATPWPSSGSISAWVYPTTYADWISPAGWKTDPNISTDGYILFDEGGSGTPGKWRAVFRPNTGGAAEAAVVAAASITQNVWQHLVFTWSLSGTTYTTHLYVNGVDQGSATWTGTPGSSGVGSFNFGKSGDYADNFFKGNVDDVRVYNRALGTAEARALYSQTAGTRFNASSATLANGSTLTKNLVAQWTFDGADITDKVYDRVGGFNGYFNSTTPTSTAKAAGKLGQGIKSDGNAHYVNVSTFTPLNNSTGITICGWIYLNTLGTTADSDDSAILGKSTNNNGEDLLLWYNVNAAGTGDHVYTFNAGSNATAANRINGTTPATALVWQHVCGVMSSTDRYLYLNGVLDATGTGASVSTYAGGSNNIRLGAWSASANTDFNGKLDDIRAYNRALSAAEIKQIYLQGGDKLTASSTLLQNGSTLSNGLVGYWSFNGADVTDKVYDRIGGNNGYFSGGATSSAKVQGKLGQALHFNGNLQYVSTSGSYPTGINPRTLCAWVKSDDTSFQGNADHVVNYGTANTAQAFGFMIFTGNHWWFFGFGGSYDLDSGIAADTKWHYHCVGYDGATVTYYYDGSSVASAARALSTTANNMTFGIRPDLAASNEFNGSIDEVRIYNRALSAAEVKQLYQLGK